MRRAVLLGALLAAAAGPASAASSRRALLAEPSAAASTSSSAAPPTTTASATSNPDGYDPNALARLDPDVLATITGTGTPRDPEAAVKGTAPPAADAADYQAPVELALDKRAPSERQTVDQVNEAAPVFKLPTKDGVVEARPSLSVKGAGAGPAVAGAPTAAPAGDDAAALAAAAGVASPGYGTAGYIPPNNPAFAAGAPAPALAALLADAAAAAAPSAPELEAREAAMRAAVPTFSNDAAQPPEATAAKPSAAAVALAGEAGKAAATGKAAAAAGPPVPPAGSAMPSMTQQQKQEEPAAKADADAAAPAPPLPASQAAALGGSAAAAAADNGGRPAAVNTASNAPDGGGKAPVGDAAAGNTAAGGVAAKGIDNVAGQVLGNVGGTTLNLLLGGRVATPFFGTGFNLCVDRYFGSFPKVGVVIPNPVAWLLPEILDVAGTLKATVDLPLGGKTAPEGARVTPTSDGFVIWLPSIQPTQLGEFGFRYGLQLAQLFGVDFGFGLLKSTCTIDFVRV